jgi:hypothetical protein
MEVNRAAQGMPTLTSNLSVIGNFKSEQFAAEVNISSKSVARIARGACDCGRCKIGGSAPVDPI